MPQARSLGVGTRTPEHRLSPSEKRACVGYGAGLDRIQITDLKEATMHRMRTVAVLVGIAADRAVFTAAGLTSTWNAPGSDVVATHTRGPFNASGAKCFSATASICR